MSVAPPNSTRISKRFAALSESGELGIVAYITAGDPSLAATHKFVLALAEAGADVIELGIPFSDPLADGPTIQRASERALKSHTTLAQVIDLVREIRKSSEVPLVLFSYYNPVLQMGLEKFASSAANAGADGVLITDLTPEESDDYRRILAAHHLDTIFLGAPTSTDDRLAKIAAVSSGFLYLISRTGVTGAKDALPDDLPCSASPRPQSHPTSHRRRLRHLASRPRLRPRRPCRCRRSRLRASLRNRKSHRRQSHGRQHRRSRRSSSRSRPLPKTSRPPWPLPPRGRSMIFNLRWRPSANLSFRAKRSQIPTLSEGIRFSTFNSPLATRHSPLLSPKVAS